MSATTAICMIAHKPTYYCAHNMAKSCYVYLWKLIWAVSALLSKKGVKQVLLWFMLMFINVRINALCILFEHGNYLFTGRTKKGTERTIKASELCCEAERVASAVVCCCEQRDGNLPNILIHGMKCGTLATFIAKYITGIAVKVRKALGKHWAYQDKPMCNFLKALH